MNREKYNIYCEMFNNCNTIEDSITSSLKSLGAKIYNTEVYVGEEVTRRYQLYVEFNLNDTYRNIRGLYTIEQINKMFNLQ